MSLLTLVFSAVVLISGMYFVQIFKKNTEVSLAKLQLTKEIGLIALVMGVLGQFIGLFEAFKTIESMGEVSPDMLAAGLKVSSITTIYGLGIYLISLMLYLGLRWQHGKSN